jgi:hypothetical protein
MKNLFTEKELQCGMFLVNNSAGRPFKDLGLARTLTFKIGFSHDVDLKYGLSSVLTDGFYVGVANSLKDMATYLNNDVQGYRPLTKDELFELINSSTQGFY